METKSQPADNFQIPSEIQSGGYRWTLVKGGSIYDAQRVITTASVFEAMIQGLHAAVARRSAICKLGMLVRVMVEEHGGSFHFICTGWSPEWHWATSSSNRKASGE